jgi:hypothetical protein
MRTALEKFSAVDLSRLKFPLDGDSSAIYNSDKKEITIPYWRVAELLNEVKVAQDMAKSALSAPPRNCDRFKSEYDYDKLHEAFVKHCDSCNCPMGCIHRRDTRCMLDTRCGSILKCFAKFVLAEAKGGANG